MTAMELNGTPVTAEQAPALAVINYAHFSSMLVDGLRVKGLQLHLDRLVRDCRLVFAKPIDPDRVRRLLHRVAAQCPEPTMLRAMVFDPGQADTEPSVLITTRADPRRTGDGSVGLRIRSVQYTRELPAVKHVGFFGALRQRRFAELAGYDDALFISTAGLVCEGPTWNVGVLIGDELIWPDDKCLPGVTRQLLQQVLDRAGIGWTNRSLDYTELAAARTAFATSSGVGVRSISSIDGVSLPGEPGLFKALRTGYAQIRGEEF
jgi:branched-subunit amino acid aminotransferase/4-amino-4-deoxychorismate lyase